MSAIKIDPPSEDLARLFAAERPLDPIPAEVSDRLFERLRRSLGFTGTGGHGGGKGSAGLGGATVGGLLAIILGAGGVTYLVVTALLPSGPKTVVELSSMEADPAWDRPHVDAGFALGLAPVSVGLPRFQNQELKSSEPKAVMVGADTEWTGEARSEEPRATPGWHGQRDVKPARVAGRVFDRGRPASGIEVVLEGVLSGADPAFGRRVVTDADGAFDFGPQAAWFYVISAVAPGRRTAATRVRVGDPLAQPRSDALRLTLDDCVAGVAGTVSDESGHGVPEARVRVLENSFNGTGVETDSNGGFNLCTRVGAVRLRIEAEGYGSVATSVIAAADVTRADIRLASEAVIEGTTIRQVTGEPIPAVQLTLWPLARGSKTLVAPASTISDSSGHFKVRGVGAGKYWLRAWAADAMGREVVVDVKSGEIKRGVVAEMYTTSTVQVQVLSRGQPVVGSSVALAITGTDDESFAAITQVDGRATLHGVFRGDVEFRLPKYRVLSPKALKVNAAHMEGTIVEVAAIAPPQ
jgi:hypothetical protein